MGHLRQLFYCGANLSILDALSFDYRRKKKFILEDDCQKYQYLVNSHRSIFIFFSNKITKYYQWYTLFDWLVYWSECHACCGYADYGNSFTEHRIIQTHLFSHTFALVTYSDCIIGINKTDWLCTLG